LLSPAGRDSFVDAMKADVRTLRLCRQAAQALRTTLSGECADEVLQDLEVASVDPAPEGAVLVVGVVAGGRSPVEVLDRLERAKGLLRSAVARAISRKRVPDLLFRILPPEA
jgi:ribosome-binding factor A